MRRSQPGSSGSIRVNINGLPHLEQGGRRLSTNLKFRGSMVRLKQRLCRWNSESIPQRKTGSAKMTVLLRIDGCRGLLKISFSLPKVYLRSPGTVCRAFAAATPGIIHHGPTLGCLPSKGVFSRDDKHARSNAVQSVLRPRGSPWQATEAEALDLRSLRQEDRHHFRTLQGGFGS